MNEIIEIELDEKVVAKINLLMAFDGYSSISEYITEWVEADWVAMNELKDADPVHLEEMKDYIGHDFGFAEEAK